MSTSSIRKNKVALNLATKLLESLKYRPAPARATDPYHLICEMNGKMHAITICSGKHLTLDAWKMSAMLWNGYVPAILFINRDGKYLFLTPSDIPKNEEE